jgi:hypothetical protein
VQEDGAFFRDRLNSIYEVILMFGTIRARFPFSTRLLAICAALSGSAFLALGQVGAGGTIVGTVTDQSGAAVPDAAIVITDVDTRTSTRATSNASGEYTAPALPVGRYTLTAELK